LRLAGPALLGAAWLVGVSGCLAPEAAPGPGPSLAALADPPDLPPPNPGVTQVGCAELRGRFPVPMTQARAAMPPGFDPVPFDGTGTAATLVALATMCEATLPTALAPGEARILAVFLEVHPPAAWRVPGASHLLVMSLRTDAPALAQRFSVWGLADAQQATVGFEVDTSAVEPLWVRHGEASADTPGGSLQLHIQSGGMKQHQQPAAARWFLAAGGGVARVVDVQLADADALAGDPALLVARGAAPLPMMVPVGPGEGRQAWGDAYGYRFEPRGGLAIG